MDIFKFLKKFSLTDFPVGLGGCKNNGHTYECCEYNITIFDNKFEEDSVIEFDNQIAKIHHGKLTETRSNVLTQYDNMKIILDDQWELRLLLSNINEKKEKIFKDNMKSCLIDSLFCVTKTKDGIKNSDPFASTWGKCAAYYIADAISIFNSTRPSPTHMLEFVREYKKNRINESFSLVNEVIGLERATPSLLQRMCKSTIGFSDMVEGNDHSKIIQTKHDYLVKNSLLADCYFYLGYINRNNVIKIKDTIHRKPELFHILKVSLDIENDPSKLEHHANLLHKTANDILSFLNFKE